MAFSESYGLMTETFKLYVFTQILMVLALVAVLKLGLLSAFLGGLFVYFLVEFGARVLGHAGVIPKTGRLILLALVALLLITVCAFGVAASASYISGGPGSFVVLLQRMADIVDAGRDYLPFWVQDYLPVSLEDWQQMASDWLRHNARNFSMVGREAGVLVVHCIIGMVVGGMIALNPAFQNKGGPLAEGFGERVELLGLAFRRIVFSQIRISALNTVLTGIFLAVILPLTGNPLPFTKTMIVVTFVAGLLPIVGNLMSNTVIFLVALSVSPFAAVGSLMFLIVIHKLEYFFNAHIIGTQIKARAWEILLAMLVMEAIFGMAGVIAAPIYYAYLKDELTEQKLI